MLQWMSANTVHMCHDVLVTELVGFLGACMKWMSSSMIVGIFLQLSAGLVEGEAYKRPLLSSHDRAL